MHTVIEHLRAAMVAQELADEAARDGDAPMLSVSAAKVGEHLREARRLDREANRRRAA